MSENDQIGSWEELAARGDTRAMGQLGAHHNRRGDLDAAHEWFFRAAEAGDPQAAAYLGWVFHMYGSGDAAIEWTRVAIRRGHPTAQAQLENFLNPAARNQLDPTVMMVMHQNRREASAAIEAGDEDMAFRLLSLGEQWGDTDSMCMLGEWWERQGTVGHAILYYQLAIGANPMGHAKSQSRLQALLAAPSGAQHGNLR